MMQSLDNGSEHATDSYFTADEKKKGSVGLVKERRADLARSSSMLIALQNPAGNKSRRGNLTFSNSVRHLSRAGTSRRHLATDDSEEAFSNYARQLSRAGTSRRILVTDESEEALSNCVNQLSRAGTSCRDLVTEESSDDSAEEASSP
jgi:hypothetical protein